MKFVFYGKDGNSHVMTDEEVLEHLSVCQVQDAIEDKQADPYEEISYMTTGGMIAVEL